MSEPRKPQPPNPKTLKLYLPGEVVESREVFQTQSGEILEWDVKRRVLVPSKKNQKEIITNKRTGKMQMIPSRQFERWMAEHSSVFKEMYHEIEAKGVRMPIVRCKVKCMFYFPDSKNRDLTNKFETIADALVDHGILADDGFKVMNPVTVAGFMCRNRPRTEIYITVIEPGSPDYEWDITSERHEEDRKKDRAERTRIRRIIKKDQESSRSQLYTDPAI